MRHGVGYFKVLICMKRYFEGSILASQFLQNYFLLLGLINISKLVEVD